MVRTQDLRLSLRLLKLSLVQTDGLTVCQTVMISRFSTCKSLKLKELLKPELNKGDRFEWPSDFESNNLNSHSLHLIKASSSHFNLDVGLEFLRSLVAATVLVLCDSFTHPGLEVQTCRGAEQQHEECQSGGA